jgi:hypothetical protein
MCRFLQWVRSLHSTTRRWPMITITRVQEQYTTCGHSYRRVKLPVWRPVQYETHDKTSLIKNSDVTTGFASSVLLTRKIVGQTVLRLVGNSKPTSASLTWIMSWNATLAASFQNNIVSGIFTLCWLILTCWQTVQHMLNVRFVIWARRVDKLVYLAYQRGTYLDDDAVD